MNEKTTPQTPPEDGASRVEDSLLKGLNTLTDQDFESIKQEAQGKTPEVSHSKRTLQYLAVAKGLYARASKNFYGTSQSGGISRDKLYQIYDEMDDSTAYITSALDILSDDATQPDEDGTLIKIESENDKVVNVLEDLFRDLEIENRLSKWARAVAKYGDLFIRIYGNTNGDSPGVTSIDDTIYPSSIERNDYKGKLVAFSEVSDTGISANEFYPPWEYIHFRHKGELSPLRLKSNTVITGATSLSSSYGQSILRAAVKVYTQLRFVENMILLSRLTNSVRRNIFAINVGNVDPTQALETLREYSDLIKKDVTLDLDEDFYSSAKHTMSYDEDIFIPVSDPKNEFNITSVGGDVNIGEQYDLEYLLNKLFAALKIPKAYLNYEQDLNARSTLIQLDIRYARSVAQLQNTLVAGLTKLAKVHLAYKGIDPDYVDFSIKLTGVSSIDQESRLEQKSARLGVARDFWDIVVSVQDTLNDSRVASPIGDEAGPPPSGGISSAISQIRDTEGGGTEESPESPEKGPPSPTGVIDKIPDESFHHKGKKLQESIGDPPQYDSALNVVYLAEKLFSEYLGFSNEDVDIILKRKTPEDIKEHRSTKKRSVFYDDSEIDYPTARGRKLYESVKNDILTEDPELTGQSAE